MSTEDIALQDIITRRLKSLLLRHMPCAGFFSTGIENVFMARLDHAGITEHRFDRPVVSLLVQGSKNTVVGLNEYELRPGTLLTVGIDMPSSSHIIDASPEMPLMTIYFYIDKEIVRDLVIELGFKANHVSTVSGVSLEDADIDFL